MTTQGRSGRRLLTQCPICVQLVALWTQTIVRTTLPKAVLVLPSRVLTPLTTWEARPTILLVRMTLLHWLTSVALETKIRWWLLHAIVAFCLNAMLHLHAWPRRLGVHRQWTRLG